MRRHNKLFRKTLIVSAIACAGAQAVLAQRSASPRPEEVGLYAQLLSMTDTRQLDMPLVERALASDWLPLRAAATMAIGQIGPDHGRAGAPRLRRLLADRDITVAADAAYALGLLRDSASIQALRDALSRNHQVAREAAWALGETGSQSRAAITAALKSRAPTDVAVQLLLASAKLRPVPIADVEPYLVASSSAVVWAAAYAIARTRVPAGVRDLISLDHSRLERETRKSAPDPGDTIAPYIGSGPGFQLAKAEVARGLAKSAAGDSLAGEALAVLSRLVSDPDSHVRINALRSIATYGSPAKSALVQATRDPDPNVRIAAAQSFGTVLSGDAAQFRALWAADTSIVYRSSLLASATRSGMRPPELAAWTASSDWHRRAAAASAEGDSLDRAFALSRATPLTRDPDPRVREAAYAALSPSRGLPLEDTVHALLIEGLRDPDFYVRATVIGALADRPSTQDLDDVLASYAIAAKDSANDARLAAVQYVTTLWKKDSAGLTPELMGRLADFPTPSDPLERAAAKGTSVWSKWSTVAPTPRPAGWYSNVVKSIVLPALAGKTRTATIYTIRGPIRLELFGADAPITVWNFLSLARSGYYRGTRFHRVVPNFVAQDGDPRDDGNGGPGYAIRDEMNRHRYERGAVGMALSGPDTGGSQYFITHSPQPHLDGHYTVFGRVIKGVDVLDRIVQGDEIMRIEPR
jgi:cyclophilin family peptidyl-prolyl cis-trans isomerase/HEAT repeat protein